ncbi:MAG: hypothetical protein U5Q44_03070 [Dehalococcoidia bacterium]|nr:hypothetical protein [Dehalococcoidia bacterium]
MSDGHRVSTCGRRSRALRASPAHAAGGANRKFPDVDLDDIPFRQDYEAADEEGTIEFDHTR